MGKKLKKNCVYRVSKDLDTIIDKFRVGEEYVFKDEAYSHYENATYLTFARVGDGSRAQVFFQDTSPINVTEYFENISGFFRRYF